MGEIADDMIEGDCCSVCGEYFDDDGSGFSRVCSACSSFDEEIDASDGEPVESAT